MYVCFGMDGKTFTSNDKNVIDDFLKQFEGVTIEKKDQQLLKNGFIFSVTLISSQKTVCNFTFGYDEITIYHEKECLKYKTSKNFDENAIHQLVQKYQLN